jgi:hypothetical protein
LWLGLQSDVDLYDAEAALPAEAVHSLAEAGSPG